MLEQALTNRVCQDIIQLLMKKRKWTLARIVRVTHTSADYIRRIQNGKQSFQMADVEALASACDQKPYRLIFDSLSRENFAPADRGLYDLGLEEIKRSEEFQRSLSRKPTRKRRSGTKAA